MGCPSKGTTFSKEFVVDESGDQIVQFLVARSDF